MIPQPLFIYPCIMIASLLFARTTRATVPNLKYLHDRLSSYDNLPLLSNDSGFDTPENSRAIDPKDLEAKLAVFRFRAITHLYDQTPNLEDQTPNVQDQTPKLETQTPNVEDQATNLERMRARITVRKTKMQRVLTDNVPYLHTDRNSAYGTTRPMSTVVARNGVECVEKTESPPPHTDKMFQTIIDIANSVFDQYGVGYTERVYQEAMYFSTYKQGIPCLMERNVFVTHDNVPLFIGRADLEVDNRLVFELKIHPFTPSNVRKDRLQLEKYLRAYALNNHTIDLSALIYFGDRGVNVVLVAPFKVVAVGV